MDFTDRNSEGLCFTYHITHPSVLTVNSGKELSLKNIHTCSANIDLTFKITSNHMVEQRKTCRNIEFQITAQYRRRNFCYRVKHEVVNDDEEIFSISAKNKTVVLTSKCSLLLNENSIDVKRVYSYNENEVTNKCLMNRIIEALENHVKRNEE